MKTGNAPGDVGNVGVAEFCANIPKPLIIEMSINHLDEELELYTVLTLACRLTTKGRPILLLVFGLRLPPTLTGNLNQDILAARKQAFDRNAAPTNVHGLHWALNTETMSSKPAWVGQWIIDNALGSSKHLDPQRLGETVQFLHAKHKKSQVTYRQFIDAYKGVRQPPSVPLKRRRVAVAAAHPSRRIRSSWRRDARHSSI